MNAEQWAKGIGQLIRIAEHDGMEIAIICDGNRVPARIMVCSMESLTDYLAYEQDDSYE